MPMRYFYIDSASLTGPVVSVTGIQAHHIKKVLRPRILRAETATVAAVALVQYLFGDMGQKNLDKGMGLE